MSLRRYELLWGIGGAALLGALAVGCEVQQDLGERAKHAAGMGSSPDAAPPPNQGGSNDAGVSADASPSSPDSGASPDTGSSDAGWSYDAGSPGTVVMYVEGDESEPSETWTYDGTEWTELNIASPPAFGFPLAFGTAGNKVVLFGGYTGEGNSPSDYNTDTWTFDGTAWTQLNLPTSPGARSAAVYASVNGWLVLYGGYSTTTPTTNLTDTWVFDGTTWTQVTSGPNPGPVGVSPMSAIPSAGKVVLYTGQADTWTFDGTSWTLVNPMSPPGYHGEGWAFVEPLDGRALFAGAYIDDTNTINTSWLFDGTTWTQTTVNYPNGYYSGNGGTGLPGALGLGPMVSYGPEVFMVAYGDSPSGGSLPVTQWLYNGSAWSQVTLPNHPVEPTANGVLAILPN